MASIRKKQDEKNLKTLRDLASLPLNKYCFDCNQRGPTYVNVTIGSFVCTKCSGMLRGLTPPHRVKSISMATFTPEEIDILRSRGNGYCKQVWLGLYENSKMMDLRDEQHIRDFMMDKYERRRYYLEPTAALQNTTTTNISASSSTNSVSKVQPLENLISKPKPLRINGFTPGNSNIKRPNEKSDFIADFGSADIYNASNTSNGYTNNNSAQPSFANFDDNPIFNSNGTPIANGFNNTQQVTSMNMNVHQTPSEDRYAALKDLDNALKGQSTLDWNNSDSYSSLNNSATPNSSVFNSSLSQGPVSQGLFTQNNPAKVSNPFNNNAMWTSNGNGNQNSGNAPMNPFRIADFTKSNGITQNFQENAFSPHNKPWTANPFTQLATTSNGNGFSNNPFL